MSKKAKEDKLEKIIKEVKRSRIIEIILIIIIILLIILFYLIAWRIGKIGYNTEETSVIIDDNEDDDIEIDVITVNGEDVELNKDTELDIFANEKFDNQKIIAPWSYGTYKFCIKNETESDITYDISFSDIMTNPVNMVYKLKIDNVYVKGNSENYVSITELDLDDVIVKKGSNNVYTLEWYWADDDTLDTYTGSQKENQYYTLNLSIKASLYNT